MADTRHGTNIPQRANRFISLLLYLLLHFLIPSKPKNVIQKEAKVKPLEGNQNQSLERNKDMSFGNILERI